MDAQFVEHSFCGLASPARPTLKSDEPTCPGKCAALTAFDLIHRSRVDLTSRYTPEPTLSIRKWGRKLAAFTPSMAAFEGKAAVSGIPADRQGAVACPLDHLMALS